MKPVAIVGGGITGLTAAFRLKQLGVPAVVFEATNRAGGVLRTVRDRGFLAECGPNTILETSPKITSLVDDLDLAPHKLYADPVSKNRYIVRGGAPVALPMSPPAFLKSHLFSTSAKLRLLREPFIPAGAADKEEALSDFVLRRLGREFLDYAINPFVAGVYAGDPKRLSVKHAFPKLHALEQQYGSLIKGQILGARERKKRGEESKQSAKAFSFDSGMQVLIDALADAVDVRRNCPVSTIDFDGFSAVMVATPAYRIPALLPELASLESVYYPPVSSLTLGFKRADIVHPLDGFGVLLPEKERFQILGALFTSTLFPGRAPEGHVTLTVYAGGVRNPTLAGYDTAALVRTACEDLNKLLGVRGEPVFVHHSYFEHAIPQYEVGYGRYRDLLTEVEQKRPGVFFAGHYRDGISVGDSIVSGHDVAGRIAAYLEGK